MTEDNLLAEQFEANRTHLQAVAYRMLGSTSEADDAVQEGWLRVSRADTEEVENLGGWLTTVISRVCLDMLRSRKARREDTLDADIVSLSGDPEREALLADAVGPALLVVLETLSPAERLSFVLHDMFAMPFEEIAPIVGRSTDAARQLASRARRRVQGGIASDADPSVQREIVSAFLAASREGNFDALVRMLDPAVVLRADTFTVAQGAEAKVLGAAGVAKTFSGRAKGARLALVSGFAGAVWSMGGTPRVVFDFTIADGKITAIDLLSDPDTLSDLELELL